MKFLKKFLGCVFSLSLIALGALLIFESVAPKEVSWFFGKYNLVSEADLKYQINDIEYFLNECRENEVTAEKKYGGSIVKVTGKIVLITDSDDETLFTVAKSSDSLVDNVLCSVTAESEYNKLLNLKTGDTVTVVGKVTECGYLVKLSNCLIVEETT